MLAPCFVALDEQQVDDDEAAEAWARLCGLAPRRSDGTETFCESSRHFHPDNGMRIDAIREGINDLYPDSWLRPVLLSSLLLAADAVDSTVGLQMAYPKRWAPRALRPLDLQVPPATPSTCC